MAEPSPLRCPHCNKPVPRPPGILCPACGRDIAGAFARRAVAPAPTGPVATFLRKYPWVVPLFLSLLFLFVAGIEYRDLTAFEANGGSYSDNSFNLSLYNLAGKWGVVAFWMVASAICLGTVYRTLRRKRGVRRS